ncbi:hypothetical protein AVEN_142365-1 [Araneus ventricosus]|uniref:Uncharacterized protein n=1 Tax=Araneus ventricosus TaxID=182803 RepID=A0A4Y2SBQ7_ARAVE|nr:hypothetical protein AVEN_142365-1 [Araneus ventricosus]
MEEPVASSDEDQESDDSFIFCNDLYSNSKDKEGWIQCNRCRGWAHEACSSAEEGELVPLIFVNLRGSALATFHKNHQYSSSSSPMNLAEDTILLLQVSQAQSQTSQNHVHCALQSNRSEGFISNPFLTHFRSA